MNEEVARNLLLVRAIETADRDCAVLSADDRVYASRSAKELARWQAADNQSEATADEFLQQRSEQILKKLGERTPAFALFMRRRGMHAWLAAALPLLALLAGVFADRITDPHRVDLLSAPLLLIVGWNLAVYLAMAIWALVPARRRHSARRTGVLHLGQTARSALPRKLKGLLATAATNFLADWAQLGHVLARARAACVLHSSAALFALGAVLSLYARGMLAQYAAGWESTFLDAAQVQRLLSVLFAPALALLPLQGFSVADIEALHFTQTPSALGGARWVHLYAATLLLLAVLPRLLLAALAHWHARGLARHFPVDLEQPYFRKLLVAMGGGPGALRVLPYSFTLDESRTIGLSQLAAMLLGDGAQVLLRPSLAYGAEPADALRGTALQAADASLTAALFNLSATPEQEIHGSFLACLKAASARPIAVLVDESAYLERVGVHPAGRARVAERFALWEQFCNFHETPATLVNLLDPAARPVDGGFGRGFSEERR